jgi:hypothetical protein
MSGNGSIDNLIKQYMPGDDARAHDSTQARGGKEIDFDALFADADNDPWWSQPALHVPEAVSTAPASKDPGLHAKSEDDDSDDDRDDDMHEGSDEASDDNSDEDSVHDQHGSTDAGVREEQACPGTSKRQSPTYRVSVQELHERFKWTDKFKSDTQYLNLKDQQKKKIEKLKKNGRKFKKALMGGIKKPETGCKDWLDALMYQKRIGWRKRSMEQNEEGMEWVCTQIECLHKYDKFFE